MISLDALDRALGLLIECRDFLEDAHDTHFYSEDDEHNAECCEVCELCDKLTQFIKEQTT